MVIKFTITPLQSPRLKIVPFLKVKKKVCQNRTNYCNTTNKINKDQFSVKINTVFWSPILQKMVENAKWRSQSSQYNY